MRVYKYHPAFQGDDPLTLNEARKQAEEYRIGLLKKAELERFPFTKRHVPESRATSFASDYPAKLLPENTEEDTRTVEVEAEDYIRRLSSGYEDDNDD